MDILLMPLMFMGSIFIIAPFAALIPSIFFLFFYFKFRKFLILITAILWGIYTAYEYGMYSRILCTGECNIRIDLLLIYPLLIIVTVIGLIGIIMQLKTDMN